jgi:hypothetical protein
MELIGAIYWSIGAGIGRGTVEQYDGACRARVRSEADWLGERSNSRTLERGWRPECGQKVVWKKSGERRVRDKSDTVASEVLALVVGVGCDVGCPL